MQIKTHQNALRGGVKLERFLKLKEGQKEKVMQIEDTQRLVTEIEMLKVLLHLMVAAGK